MNNFDQIIRGLKMTADEDNFVAEVRKLLQQEGATATRSPIMRLPYSSDPVPIEKPWVTQYR